MDLYTGVNYSLQFSGFLPIDPVIYQTMNYLKHTYAFFFPLTRYLLKVAELFEKLRVREASLGAGVVGEESLTLDVAVLCYTPAN